MRRSTVKARRDFVIPYPLKRVFRGFGKCRRGKRRHLAIDIGGVGKNWGLGTPIVAMVRSKVVFIGLSKQKPKKFGRPDRRRGKAKRGRSRLPRTARLKGYGRVHFFTRSYGSWRSGNIIITRALEGSLKGHTIRYMHLGAVHPRLKKGSVVAKGQEIGVMGGTAVQEAAPHLHLDITNEAGVRLDVALLFGLTEKPHPPCSADK